MSTAHLKLWPQTRFPTLALKVEQREWYFHILSWQNLIEIYWLFIYLYFSGKDNMLPSVDEARRLSTSLQNCKIMYFRDNGHTILLVREESFPHLQFSSFVAMFLLDFFESLFALRSIYFLICIKHSSSKIFRLTSSMHVHGWYYEEVRLSHIQLRILPFFKSSVIEGLQGF